MIQMKNKKILIIIIVVLVILAIIGGILGYIKIWKPYNEAVKNYDAVVAVINEKNKELDENIEKVEQLIDSNEKVIDESVIEKAKDVTKEQEQINL